MGLWYRYISSVFISMILYSTSFGQVIETPVFWKAQQPKSISLQFDNDTYYYTDYYYTVGIDIDLILPSFSKVPWMKVFPTVSKESKFTSGISLAQRLYTPKNIRDTLVQFNDRPFAATLELDQFAFSLETESGIEFYTRIRVGIMGPAAGGEYLQRLIHDWINSPDAKGWDYQIRNGIILNYDFMVSYPIYHGKSMNFSALGSVRAGTLFDDISAGFNFSFGNYRDSDRKKFKYSISLDALSKLVGYNALLQGGIFASNDPYVLTYSEITPIVFSVNMTIGVSWYGVVLSVGHNFLTKEFDSGINHNYASIKLAYQF